MAIISWLSTFLNGTATVLFHCVLRCFHLDSFMGPDPQEQINPSIPSSSSSFHSTPPSSSSHSWKHDVFLSFRGTDTRNNFVDHLYSALVQQGIGTYKDDKTLPRGETIGPSLLKAIEESHIAVIIFSENYADSSWCLQELAHIMKCKDERGLIVMPIFYHIDPSELRKQKGIYGVALAKHKSEDKNVWRKALVDAGNLSGDVFNGPETIFIKQIIDTISNRLPVAISSDNEDLIGIQARVQDLKSKMEMEPDGVLMVGIWGFGGGGKTTLASSLYDEISCDFDGSCFLKDVREESSKHGLPRLQKEILSLVFKLKTEEVTGDVGRLIKSRFRHKKVLMVLDDVDHLDQLSELAGSNAWFGKGSRIVITTRDNHLLTAHKVGVVYNISLLNDDEAIQLFSKHAFLEHEPVEDYAMLSKEVVSYAGGLPLALKVLGSFLCDKDMSEWKSALARLKEIPHSDIVEKLKISYDGLNPVEKELFLDIACFLRGELKDNAMESLDACGFHPIIGVKVLTEKALITVSKAGRFKMHDLIQEMGHYIVRGENPKNPELHSRVWQLEDVAKMDAMKENDKIKALQVSFIPYTDSLPSSLPQVIDNMKKLRWFSWHKYPETSFSREFQPKELCFLRLEDSLLEQLWEGYKHLPNLKVLNLANSRKLIRTPDFGGLPCLERITFSNCEMLTEIHPSIGYLERLIFLDMSDCRSLELFPPIIRMKKLQTLILSDCIQLRKFPEIQTSMDNLKELRLRGSGIEVVPSSIGEYCTNLLSLDLRRCSYLHSIEGNFHHLKHLIELYLNGCNQLNIPAEGLLDVECCLQQLSLSSIFLGSVRQGVNGLFCFPRFLTRLSLCFFGLVDGDISVLCKELSNLEALDLSYNKFSRLHSGLSQLPRLKYLNLSDCYNLVELPDLPSSISVLIAEWCSSLFIKGDFPTNQLKWLWKVSLSQSNYIGKRVLQLMLQGNAIEDYFVSIQLDKAFFPISDCKLGIFTLLLPQNWYDQFSGFLVYVDDWLIGREVEIILKDVTGSENQTDVLEEYNGVEGSDRLGKVGKMCYIPFNLLSHSSRWNRENTAISFSINNDAWLKVELVRKRSQSDDSIKRAKGKTYRSEFWDEESWDQNTFEVIDNSRSSIKIKWCHDVDFQMSPASAAPFPPSTVVSGDSLHHSPAILLSVTNNPAKVNHTTARKRTSSLATSTDSSIGPPQEQINPSIPSSSFSSHSTPTPSSSSQPRKHDVFLSFRGTDTRNTFVDHLYSALEQQGIYTYKDDKTLPRGETIGPSLLKAIEELLVAVVVFSENYADSSWCLQELAHIMKCRDERDLIVMPIFYHVDPSELRKQKGKYGAALAKHVSEKKNVESWRKALADAGNLSGDVANGPETVFIKQIVDTLSNRLMYAPISSDHEDLIGIEARLQDLKSKMEMEPDGVLMVGIWGLGGGGKTTLASALYNEISTNFDGSCFIKDVREESSKHGLEKLQEKVLSLVLKQKEGEVVGDVGRLIKSRFRRKKVLMVLDDVDHLDQLKELAGSNVWFGEGSRIIITTRDNHFLNAHKVHVIYNISLLNDEEAMKLFYMHAPRGDRPLQDYEMLSKDVVSYAHGLPLALKVLGSFLCDKDMSECGSALARLKEIPDGDIVQKLKISYDGLEPMDKELFLDIACFFRGKWKDMAMEIFEACGFHPLIRIKVLRQKALITLSKEGSFEMHDLIQEMGHYIVRGENHKNPELHSRVWKDKDVVRICAMDSTKVNDSIKALKVLFRPDRQLPPSLREAVGNMKRLRWISCTEFPATSLPREFHPMELCYLKLGWSRVEQLWEGYKHLPNLKVLDLRGSSKLSRTPDFDGLPCLERLILKHCDSLKELHPSIGYHESIIFLDLEWCSALEIFPPIIRMKKLETLLLSGCSQLRKFPEIQTSLDNLVKLTLRNSGIEIVPSSVGRYCTNLLSLDLRGCLNLHSIEGNFHRLQHLKGLYLDGCNQLKNIPTEGLFDVECSLQLLSLSLTPLQNLHRGTVNGLLGFSHFLRRLNLRCCNLVDGDISPAFCKGLSNLQALDLCGNKFSRLHSSLLQLPRLKFLNLSSCESLVELPDLPSSIAILIAERCKSLDIVGDFPTSDHKWLWKVSLTIYNTSGDGGRIVQSMLQGNAVEDYFISILLCDDDHIGDYIPIRGFALETFTLQLPCNWYNEFSGFLVYIDNCSLGGVVVIIITDALGMENEDEVSEVSDKTDDDEDTMKNEDEVSEASDKTEDDEDTMRARVVSYISFGSLRNTSWWSSTHDTISFFLEEISNLKVELVPRRTHGDDSRERAEDITHHLNFWDEESTNKKTFEIISDSKSSIEIQYRRYLHKDVFQCAI
ncbi:hypothetical protein OSB04_018642 [Centaurea solstitialis]|uniref:ADP-ribosyl cyclase/cyclic ADP-ribose hydrolase n=1 Tax=Centaurea solstitialis TaxID=347529 RepID=A0AA38WBQ9_9ASTR|nr:hypothetical protein OSB04_018642 [Centaurea solstitialis]